MLGAGCTGTWHDNGSTVDKPQPGPFEPRYHRVYTTWKKPSFGTVAGYLVFRAQDTSINFVQICGTAGHPACPGANDTDFVDEDELPNNVSFTYYTKAQFNDDTQNQLSGPSNSATINGANGRPVAVAEVRHE